MVMSPPTRAMQFDCLPPEHSSRLCMAQFGLRSPGRPVRDSRYHSTSTKYGCLRNSAPTANLSVSEGSKLRVSLWSRASPASGLVSGQSLLRRGAGPGVALDVGVVLRCCAMQVPHGRSSVTRAPGTAQRDDIGRTVFGCNAERLQPAHVVVLVPAGREPEIRFPGQWH